MDISEQAEARGVQTYIQRMNNRPIETCLFGTGGTCCRICSLGPCMIIESAPDTIGICGATADTVAARNFARMVAAGSSAHIDHALEVALGFMATARGETDFEIKDERALHTMAKMYDIEIEGRDKKDIALDVGEKSLAEFGRQEGSLYGLRRAPKKLQEMWERTGVAPRGIQREVVDTMHRTNMGNDQDYRNLIKQATRVALADGWGASMIATGLQDIMFKAPKPIRSTVNVGLGVLSEDKVNITLHGHDPLLVEAMAIVSQEPEIEAAAKKVGAAGVNMVGVCCSGVEGIMRHGIPVAGGLVQQEMVIASGAVEAMVVDIQCIMQSLPEVAKHYHTEVITTSDRAKIVGATHIQVNHHNTLAVAREIILRAVARFPKRGDVHLTENKEEVVVGFTFESVKNMLGGKFRASYKPLNDNIVNGRIRGVGVIVGCSSPRTKAGDDIVTVAKELIKNNVMVVATGCAATECGRAGLLRPEAAMKYAGDGLREVCEAIGMPPALHRGSCVDNSRMLVGCTELVEVGGLGDDFSQLPAAGCAPEWMSEKALAIGQYYVGSGLLVVFGRVFPTSGSKVVTDYLCNGIENDYGGKWAIEEDPIKMAHLMMEHIEKKRDALGINQEKQRVLYDMAMRRDLDKDEGSGIGDVGCAGS
jgi:carbon-monoxide dehydrogenase catalytic subunit